MPNQNYIFANTINGNPLYADRAEHDADGNLISTTYATKAELPEGVPTVTSSDDGKVLQASYSGGTGSVSWVTPSGGGSEVIGAFTYQDRATSEVINKVIIGSSTSNEYKTLVGTGSYSDDLFGAQSFSAQTGFVSGSTLVWINPQGQDWGNLFSVNSIFGLGEFRTMTGTDSTRLSFDHPVPGWFKGQGRLVQFASNQESNSVIWEAQFDMPEFDNGSYTWYYNKAYTCKVTKVNGTFTSGYGLLFVIVNGEDAPDFYEHNLSYISDYILTGNYLYGYSGNAIIHACKNITLDKVNGVPNTSGYSQGDVLTIDSNGGAVWATPSGGGSRIVELTVGTSTWSDFTTAYSQLTAGTIDGIRAKATGSAGDYYADLVDVDKAFGSGMLIGANFSAPSYSVSSSGIDGRRISSKLYNLSSTGVWTTTTHKALTSDIVAGAGISVSTDASYNIVVAASDPLPAHTSTDEGKVLKIVSGVPTWVTP